MAKTYYSIDTATRGYPVYWVDELGNKHREDVEAPTGSPADVDMEFQIAHPGAVYLKWNDFCKRLEQLAADKEKLAAWNAGESIRVLPKDLTITDPDALLDAEIKARGL